MLNSYHQVYQDSEGVTIAEGIRIGIVRIILWNLCHSLIVETMVDVGRS